MKTNKQCNGAPRVACFWSDYQIVSFLKAKRESKKPLSDSIPKGLQVTLLYRCFSRIFNCTDGTKSHKASHIR